VQARQGPVRSRGCAICALALVIFSPSDAPGEILLNTSQDYRVQVTVRGAIVPPDYTKLTERVIPALTKPDGTRRILWVNLNSPGGSVETALRIGRFLRKHEAVVWVDENDTCISACVFVLAGGVARAVYGTVAIHRPFDPVSNETTTSGQRDWYRKLGTSIRAYLEEMNIPPRLYDDMLFISPDQVRALTRRELQTYGLDADDPYWEEASTTRGARERRLTPQEYRARQSRGREQCGEYRSNLSLEDNVRIARCQDAVMNGQR
jgi:hypothetical protein